MSKNTPLNNCADCGTIAKDVYVFGSREELEKECRQLLARLQWLYQQLGHPPLLTKKQRRMANQ
jgi:hypothetical protein